MPQSALNLKVSPNLTDPVVREELEHAYNRIEQEFDRLYSLLGVSVPIGGGLLWYGPSSTVPPRFAPADGRPMSKTKFPGLFAAIGYRYGGADDSFNLPDARGKLVAGAIGGVNTAELFANYGDTVEILQGAGDAVDVLVTIPLIRTE